MSGKSGSAVPVTADAEQALSLHVVAVQEKMRRSVMIGRLQNDPLADVVDAMADAIGIQHELHLTNFKRSRLAEAEHRRPVDEVATLGIEAAAAAGASAQTAKLVRVHLWRTGVIAGAVLAGVGVLAAFGGYAVGRNSMIATASAIEAAAMRDGPKAADMWLTWMRNNDGRLVASACEAEAVKSSGGRRGCGVGLWLEPPGNAMPRTVPMGR
ncbi:MAG: hypothetical protein ACRYF2_08125 [Janthinobacterium lividum]